MENNVKVVDCVDALIEKSPSSAKLKGNFRLIRKSRSIKSFLPRRPQQTKCVYLLPEWRLKKRVWALSKTRSSKPLRVGIYLQRVSQRENLRRHRRRQGIRHQKDCRARRTYRCGYPHDEPHFDCDFKTLISLKTRNGIIISPHPRAKKSTIAAAKVVLDAAVKAGAPEDIIGWIDVPSLEMTNLIMKEADIILATGGPGMVKAAYSSGKPALGVGAGNTPAIIDDTADIVLAVSSIIHSKTFDNGMICASEQSVIVLDKVYDAVKNEFADRGCYFLNPEETEKVRKTILINGALNAKIVGQKAATIASLSGVTVPEGTKILIGEVESVDLSEEFAHEKLSPVLAMYRAKDIQDAFTKAERLIADGGYGHTSSIYLNEVTERAKLDEFQSRMKTCRVLVNTPSSQGGIGDLYNFRLTPSLTLGCGTWGGNSVSENVGVKHLINIKTVAERRENMLWFRAPEKVYIKKAVYPSLLTS